MVYTQGSSPSTTALCDPAEQPLPGAWLASLGDRLLAGEEHSRAVVVSSGPSRALRLLAETSLSQPAFACTGSIGVIFDGVLYNRKELSIELAESPEPFSNEADLVLQAYLRWGENAPSKLKGIFAAVIWDGRRDLLLCVRDPLGVYPLYYAEAGRELLVSTSIDSLLRHPCVSRAVNRPALADQLRYVWVDAQETVYAQVNRVPPGHVLLVSPEGRRVYRYWDPAPPGSKVNWIREDELEQFDELLDQAVDRCLQFGPAGIYLSGGLDSVTIAAVATEKSRQQGLPSPLALSLVFPHPEANEEAIQKSVARDLGLAQVLMPVDEAVAPDGLVLAGLEMSRTSPMPLMNIWLPAYRNLGMQGRRRGCRAIFTGTGGDEWLTVSPFLAADLMRRLDVLGFCRLWNCLHRSVRRSRLAILRYLLWGCGAKPLLYQSLRRAAPQRFLRARRHRVARRVPHWLAPDASLRQELIRRGERPRPHAAPGEAGFYVSEMRTALDHPLVSWELEENFENGKMMGVRVLQPFWDSDLVDLLYRTPPSLLNRGGRSKGLVRESLARRFPDLGFDRQKKVEATNFYWSILLTQGARAWREMGGVRALAELGIVDRNVVSSDVGAILTQNQGQEAYRVANFLTYEAWLRPRI